MARVELSYQERIKELEQEKHDLKERLFEKLSLTDLQEESCLSKVVEILG